MYLTIEGFEKLSQQEIFDMSVAHIASTRKKSMDGSQCVYSGSGCAAACFLKPECRERADSAEPTHATFAGSSGWYGLQINGLVPVHEADLVAWLQECHDDAPEEIFMQQWKENMVDLAAMCGLSTEKLDAVPA